MNITRYPYKHKDNVSAQLNAGISAGTLSIPLKAGNGAQFPTTYGATATSGGTAVLLNSTGIGATGVAVGDIIENVTDGSLATITAVNTNSVSTTRLKGGSSNTWTNTNKWAVNRFIITLINYDVDGVTVLKREKVLIDSRSTDTLTVNASGRGFDGSTAQSFSANDYVYIFWTSAASDGIRQAIAELSTDVDALISQSGTEVYAADGGGTDAYSITLVPAPAAYVTGQVFNFKANTANTGAASLNVNGLGAKTIKKYHDQDLDDNDIEVGQVMTVIYDGTNFEMQSQLANVFAPQASVQNGSLLYAADAGANDSYAITLSPAPAAYTTGMVVNFKANTANTNAATLNVNSLGAKTIKKSFNVDLDTGDIKAGQFVTVIYDGTNFEMQSPSAITGPIYASGSFSKNFADASTTQNIAHGLGKAPKFVRMTYLLAGSTGSTGVYIYRDNNGSTTTTIYDDLSGPGSSHVQGSESTNIIHHVTTVNNDKQLATIAVDATNLILTWTKTNGPTGTGVILWEAVA